ncbi:TPA: hypothetical protein ACOTG0_002098 [Clostridium perfringens]|nr:hypothetical protein phiCPD_00011 [Clostridium phage phiCp-D]
MQAIEKLGKLLLEEKYPFFELIELEFLLEENNNDVYLAAYFGCLQKSKSNKNIKVGPVEIEKTDEAFWLRLAETYKDKSDSLKILEGKPIRGYKTRMKRADDL